MAAVKTSVRSDAEDQAAEGELFGFHGPEKGAKSAKGARGAEAPKALGALKTLTHPAPLVPLALYARPFRPLREQLGAEALCLGDALHLDRDGIHRLLQVLEPVITRRHERLSFQRADSVGRSDPDEGKGADHGTR